MNPPLERLIEQHSRLRGVVVGQHNQRVHSVVSSRARLGRRRLRDHIDSLATAAHEAAHDPRAVLGLIHDPRERRRCKQRARRPSPAPHERSADHPNEAKARRRRRERPPRGLILRRDGQAIDRGESVHQPLRRLALARRAGGAVELRQRLHDLMQDLPDSLPVRPLSLDAHAGIVVHPAGMHRRARFALRPRPLSRAFPHHACGQARICMRAVRRSIGVDT